jgi:hypothetical protein
MRNQPSLKQLLIPLAFALCASLACAQFFPKRAFDDRGDEFTSKWYSRQLRALKEPSLFLEARTPHAESYRFLWLRTFHHPIAIRIDVKPDGTGILTTKIATGAGGYSPGILKEEEFRPLSRAEIAPFLAKVDKLGFWSAPTHQQNEELGCDGSQWIIEGVKRGKYHVVDRWSPRAGIAHELGTMLAFDLGKLEMPAKEVY